MYVGTTRRVSRPRAKISGVLHTMERGKINPSFFLQKIWWNNFFNYICWNQSLNQEMKKPTSLEDYKAYAFGYAMVIALLLSPFAILKILTYVFWIWRTRPLRRTRTLRILLHGSWLQWHLPWVQLRRLPRIMISLLNGDTWERDALLAKMTDDEFYYGYLGKNAMSSSNIKLLTKSPSTTSSLPPTDKSRTQPPYK